MIMSGKTLITSGIIWKNSDHLEMIYLDLPHPWEWRLLNVAGISNVMKTYKNVMQILMDFDHFEPAFCLWPRAMKKKHEP